MGPRRQSKSGTFAVLTSAALFGTTGTVLVLAPPGADARSVGPLRLLVGAATLAVFTRVGRSAGAAGARRPPAASTMAGAAGVAVFQLGYFLAVERTGVAIGTVVTIGSGPVIAGIAAGLADRRSPPRRWSVGTALGILGVGLLGLLGRPNASGSAEVVGIVLAVAAGAGWATFAGVGRRQIIAGVRPTTSMAAMFAGGGLLLAPVLIGRDVTWVSTLGGVATVTYLGVCTVGIAYWLYGIGLSELPAPTVITLTLLEPLTAAMLAKVVVGETLTAAGWSGVAVVVAGLFVAGTPVRPATTRLQR